MNRLAVQVHDAYIELVQLLEPSDPQAAVEVYSRFPLKPVAEQSFDDAFITGEIVRLLMTLEQYDHPQLGPSLAAYGKVMGLSEFNTIIVNTVGIVSLVLETVVVLLFK